MRVGYMRCRSCARAATYSIGKTGGCKADESGETWTHEGRDTSPLASYFEGTVLGGLSLNSLSVNRLLQKLAITVTVASLLFSSPTVAQVLPPAEKAACVEITQEPALELARDDLAIIRWATNNPGGSDEHFGVVHYGTDPKNPSETAKSHIRLNRGHSYTVFRVRMDGLTPKATYYYTVISIESDGKSDGEENSVNRFTTPGPGEVISAFPPRPVPQPR